MTSYTRSGEFVQFVKPGLPTLYGFDGNHDASLTLDLTSGATTQIVWNHVAKTAHPIHIHV